jgi:hypothetical protein
MPNYANNSGAIVARNEQGKELIQGWMDDYEKGNEGENTRNFCDVFIPEPKWEDFIDGEGHMCSGGWNGEKVWVELPDGSNRKLTDVEKQRLVDAEITENIIGSYHFCGKVWGTKWGLFDEDVEMSPDGSDMSFAGTTAWGPFDGMWNNVVDRLNEVVKKCLAEGMEVPDIYVEHDWDERGCDEAGRITVQMYDGVYEFHHESWDIEEALEVLGDDHSTLPDPQNYFYEQREWREGDLVFEGDALAAYKDADLVFCNEGKPVILVPSTMTAYYVGEKLEIVKAPESDEFYVV